jgi:prolyl-tRNA synthetase
MSGAMGGSKSEEFLSPTPIGEDTYVRSPGGYAANVEAVTTPVPPPVDWADAPAAHVEDTPDTPTIDTLVAVANDRFPRPDRAWAASDTLKNVVLAVTNPAGERSLLVVGLPGDRDADMTRLEAALSPSVVEAATEDDFKAHPELVKGYIGPGALGPQVGEDGIPYFLDPRVVPGTRWITGANEAGRHVFDLTAGRDFTSNGTIEAATVREGDPAPDGSGPLHLARGVEIGHIFQLGRKYAEALGLQVLDENGKQVTVTMGSYGIGVTRAVALLAENNNDELGLKWPIQVAPYQVHVVATGREDAVFEAGESLANGLEAAGVEVCYDDRPKVSPGVKFKDAELLGAPFILVVGRGLEAGEVELKTRASGESENLHLADAVATIAARVTAALNAAR